MAEILIDVLDEKGNPTGAKKTKVEVHEGGLWHKAAWVWIYNTKGEVLLQKRSKIKDSHPGLWDISVAGHVDSGEEPLDAAKREVEEEIGITVKSEDLKLVREGKVSKYNPENGWQNNEFNDTYLYNYDGKVDDLKLQGEEVECMQFMLLDQFAQETNASEKSKKYVPHGEYFQEVIDAIKKELD